MESTSSVGLKGFTMSVQSASHQLCVVLDKYLGGEQGGTSATSKAGGGGECRVGGREGGGALWLGNTSESQPQWWSHGALQRRSEHSLLSTAVSGTRPTQ